MERLLQTLKQDHNVEIVPKTIETLSSVNYYLFGVIEKGMKKELKSDRKYLIEKLNRSELFFLFLKEGKKNTHLEKLFKEIGNKWEESRKLINENTIIVIKRLNWHQVTIELEFSLEEKKKDVIPLSEKVRRFSGQKSSKRSTQSPKEAAKYKYITRDFATQILQAIKEKHPGIKVPNRRIENITSLNYYLFGIGTDCDLEPFHLQLIQAMKKQQIFDLVVEVGLKNEILGNKFARWRGSGRRKEE